MIGNSEITTACVSGDHMNENITVTDLSPEKRLNFQRVTAIDLTAAENLDQAQVTIRSVSELLLAMLFLSSQSNGRVV